MSEDLDCLLGNLVSYDYYKPRIDMIKTMLKVPLLVRLNLTSFSVDYSYYDNDKSIAGMVTSSTSPSVLHGADCEGHS